MPHTYQEIDAQGMLDHLIKYYDPKEPKEHRIERILRIALSTCPDEYVAVVVSATLMDVLLMELKHKDLEIKEIKQGIIGISV
jgi:hypothetical protein